MDDICVRVGRDVDSNRAGNLAVTATKVENSARTLRPQVELRRVGYLRKLSLKDGHATNLELEAVSDAHADD